MKNPNCCDVCGEYRIRTPSGRVCPNGHGRIYPPTVYYPKATHQGKSPDILYKPNVYTLEWHEGLFRMYSPKIHSRDTKRIRGTLCNNTFAYFVPPLTHTHKPES